MTFTEVFGGTTIYPSGVSYRAVALSADQTLAWPVETATSGNVVAQIMDITPSAGSLSIIMPPANEVSVGETTLFFNPGAFTFTVKDNGGNTIVAVAPGLSYQVYLIGNTTVNGTWRSTQYAAGTSSATAGSLVGAGIKAISTTLNQSMSVTTLNSNYAIGDADRSEAFVWTGGAGALTLPASGTVGNDWFCHIRNGGTGAITVTPTGSELINGSVNLTFNPGDSAIVICDGSSFFTIGFGQSASFAFDYVSIDLSSPVTSPYTLSGANLNRIAYSFGGALTANMQVYIPATIQQYWISNDTSGAFSLTVKVAGQVGVVIPQGSRGIYYCNGTDIIDADTASFAFPLTVAQGGTGATTESGARVNLGGTSVGIAVFTAVTAADGRNALIAAKSGANSDITSLSGLTTPLSVPQGGSGVATLTANGVVLGNGASALSATAVGTTGQVLVGNTGAAPSWATLTGIGVTSFSAGTTGLTPSTATTGAITLAGTLGVANGGTGTASVFPSGSVVFAGASGVYTHDNTKFFWDDANDRLGIATASPTATLTANGTAKIGEGAASNTSKLMVNTLSGTSAGIQLIQDANESWIIQNPASTNVLTFGNSGTERMRITSAGNVGIGTSSPNNKLTVNGAISAFQTGVTDQFVVTPQTAGSGVQLVSSNEASNAYRQMTIDGVPIVINAAGTEAMRIVSGGNVGIGTSSPAYKLDVYGGASGTDTRLRVANAASNIFAGIFSDNTTFIGGTFAQPLLFLTNAAEAMRITSAGNVGIGTGSPAEKLTVQTNTGTSGFESGITLTNGVDANLFNYVTGTAATDKHALITVGATAQSLAFGTLYTERMRILADGNVLVGRTTAYVQPYRMVVNGDSALSAIPMAINDDRSGTADSRILAFLRGGTETGYITSTNNTLAIAGSTTLTFQTVSSEQMRITNTGNVGIGTSSPQQKFVVSDGGAGGIEIIPTGVIQSYNRSTSAYQVINYDASIHAFRIGVSEAMRITSAGDVGIGTSSPGAKLEVVGNYRQKAASGNTNGFNVTIDVATDVVSLTNFYNAALAFGTNNTERMRISSDGNLLVGTTANPQTAKLYVVGTSYNATAIRVASDGNVATSYLNGSGTEVGYVQVNTSATVYSTSSDVRLKENIADADDTASLIDALQVRKFDWKVDGEHQRYGFVAQELVTVAPEAVSQPANPDAMMGVDYSKLVPMLVKEIQSLRARVAQLEGN